MTVQELIIGHYDKTLTPDQESELTQMLEESPQVRTMYEQHGSIHAMMEAEATTLTPSRTLRDATIGAALSLVSTTIGGSIVGGWLTGKAIGIIGLIVAGAVTTGVILNELGDNDAQDVPPATTIEQPAVTAPPSEELAPPVLDVEESGGLETTDVPSGTEQNPAEQRRDAATATSRQTQTQDRTPETNRRSENDVPLLDINDTNPTTIKHDVQVAPRDSD